MSPFRNNAENVENVIAMAQQNRVLSITQTLKGFTTILLSTIPIKNAQ
jgi:hypothetical protein